MCSSVERFVKSDANRLQIDCKQHPICSLQSVCNRFLESVFGGIPATPEKSEIKMKNIRIAKYYFCIFLSIVITVTGLEIVIMGYLVLFLGYLLLSLVTCSKIGYLMRIVQVVCKTNHLTSK